MSPLVRERQELFIPKFCSSRRRVSPTDSRCGKRSWTSRSRTSSGTATSRGCCRPNSNITIGCYHEYSAVSRVVPRSTSRPRLVAYAPRSSNTRTTDARRQGPVASRVWLGTVELGCLPFVLACGWRRRGKARAKFAPNRKGAVMVPDKHWWAGIVTFGHSDIEREAIFAASDVTGGRAAHNDRRLHRWWTKCGCFVNTLPGLSWLQWRKAQFTERRSSARDASERKNSSSILPTIWPDGRDLWSQRLSSSQGTRRGCPVVRRF